MDLAIAQAKMAAKTSDDVPVGAAVLDFQRNLIAIAHNKKEFNKNPTAHAEVIALSLASSSLDTWRLDGCTLVVTLEPCLMCAGAILQSRISRVVIGAWNSKSGACGSVWDVLRDSRVNNKVEVISGVLEEECAKLLNSFFSSKR